jgi:hypothetical protein
VDENAKLQCRVGGKSQQYSPIQLLVVSEVHLKELPSYKLETQVSQDSSPDDRSPVTLKLGFRMSTRNIEQQGIVTSFIQDLFPIGQSTMQLSFIGSWLWHVPQVLQKSNAMDLAAEALALVYYARKTNSKETLVRSSWVYTNALRALSRALQAHCSRFASETLCATLLLVHYEVSETSLP